MVIPRICSVSIRSFPFILFPIVVLHQQYSWSNNRESTSMSRIDRFLYTDEWRIVIPQSLKID